MINKKLIEVALPLDAINDASLFDKSPLVGTHPKDIHHYPARLPLPAARSILFASLIDDPSSNLNKFPSEDSQEKERERLFKIIRKLCEPKIHLKPEIYKEAYEEIKTHCDDDFPITHDPFSGGGSIPLEGMRLGMKSIATDLNPVSVLLNKSNIELLPKYAESPPINPNSARLSNAFEWKRARGVYEDILYYGDVINKRINKRLYSTFPKLKNNTGEIISYLWARTVICPNPACGCEMPLVKSFALKSKKEPKVFFKPIIERSNFAALKGFEISQENPGNGTIKRSKATCFACGEAVSLNYLKEQGKSGNMRTRMTAIVVKSGRGKTYISPTKEQEEVALNTKSDWSPDFKMSDHPQYMAPPRYGLTYFKDIFSDRQLLSLTTISDEIHEIYKEIFLASKDEEYSKLIVLYLFFAVDRLADYNCSLSTWMSSGEQQKHVFTASRLSMAWDFAEANVIGDNAICWSYFVRKMAESVSSILTDYSKVGQVFQKSAEVSDPSLKKLLVSTDPPYYNNIPYADLMDFFYVWLKKNLEPYYPELTKTLLTPKAEELVANEFRFGGDKEKAKEHFEGGFKRAFTVLKNAMDNRFPMTIYYAFKQEEEEETDETEDGTTTNQISLTTGWETILEAVVQSGFQITATWPLRASQQWRLRAMGSNALASYIVMVCRMRNEDAPSITRRQYLQELKKELPIALTILQHSNLAPVDLAQAALGPGMGIYSRYTAIQEQDGTRMKVRTALSLINKTLDEILTEQEGDFDAETRWALAWFEQYGSEKQQYGPAESLSRAKGTAVNALVESGVITAGGGNVKLLSREELSIDWDPLTDKRTVVWEMTQHLIKHLQEKGEMGAAKLYKKLGAKADVSRELAYRLFTISEKKGWAQEAQAYNSLVLSWNQIVSESYNIKDTTPVQQKLDF
jgi:putative DNA methylase